MNKAILIGNLTRDPELSTTPSGVAVCKFSIAVARDYANADGERQTDFFNCVAWRGVADNVHKYLKKGNKCCVSGRIENRSYDDKDGNKRYITEIIAENVEFLTPKNQEAEPEVVSMKRERPQLEALPDNKLPWE